METTAMGFGVIQYLDNKIAEVIIDEGVEMNDAMVDAYHAHLDDHYSGPFALLVNKKNNYTYTFSAQQQLANLPNIRAMAVVVYRRSTEIATRALLNVKRDHAWNLKTFYDRDEALAWLKSELSVVDAIVV